MAGAAPAQMPALMAGCHLCLWLAHWLPDSIVPVLALSPLGLSCPQSLWLTMEKLERKPIMVVCACGPSYLRG